MRGAATVELALGATLFVTVLMVGIHFGEVMWLSLKVHEAQQFAVFRATGERTHLFSDYRLRNPNLIYDGAKQIRNTAAARAERAYRDFDGTKDRAPGLSQVFTRAAPIQVACGPQRRIGFEVGTGRGRGYQWVDDQRRVLRRYFRSPPALQCRASSRLGVMGIPVNFLEGSGGFFSSPQVMRTTLPICGMGVARGGACRGELAVLTGDWALEGPRTGRNDDLNRDVRLGAGKSGRYNQPYRRLVKALYDAGKGSHGRHGSRYAAMVAEGSLSPNNSPHDEREFFMSYRGAEKGYVDGLRISGRKHHWNTSGVYFQDSTNPKRRKPRPACFLGLPGCK